MTDDVNNPLDDPETQAAVRAAGKELAAAQARAAAISRKGDEIYDQAEQEFGKAKLDKALSNFKAFDGLKVELAEVLLDTPEGHRVLYEIAKDPNTIDRLYKLTPAKMIAEVARMVERIAGGTAKKAAASSGSDGSAAGADWRDPRPESSMKDWIADREKYLGDKRKAQKGGVRIY
jgi:hypothetical protein